MGGRQIGVSGDNERAPWWRKLGAQPPGEEGPGNSMEELDKQQGAAPVFKQGSDAVTFVF